MAYHMTIKYTGQMSKEPSHFPLSLHRSLPSRLHADNLQVDEFSMLYATSAILFAALSITLNPSSRTFLRYAVSCIAFVTSIVHYCLDYTPGFQIVFGTMVFTVFCECVWLVKSKVDDREVVRDMKQLALYGAVSWLGGYALWNVDNEFCAELRGIRDVVGMPLGFVLEFHGW